MIRPARLFVRLLTLAALLALVLFLALPPAAADPIYRIPYVIFGITLKKKAAKIIRPKEFSPGCGG